MEWSQALFTQDPAAEGSVEGDEEAVAAATTETRLSEGGIVQLSTTSRADLDLDDDEDGGSGSDEGGVALALCVISLDRYIPDQTAVKMLQLSSSPSGDDDGDDGEGVSTAERQQWAEEASAYADLFDVTLTDGALKRKCLLHPSLNSLVYAGRLAPDMVIKVVRWRHWFDETVIGGDGIIVLTSLSCTMTGVLVEPEAIEYAEQAASREHSASPLIGTRGYYLHVNNDTCIYGRNWGRLENERQGLKRELDLNEPREDDQAGSEAEEDGNDADGVRRRGHQRWHGRLSVSNEELERLVALSMDEFLNLGREEAEHGRGNLYTIAEVMDAHESMGGGQRAGAGPFLARVVQKSKVIHYAKVTDTNQAKYPLRCQLVVRDRTGSATVVLWANMCAYYYPHLEIGDLVLIGKYKIKPAYPHPHGPPWEFALNAGTSFIYKLNESQWPRVSRISYDIVTSSKLDEVGDGGEFDYLGRVSFAGRQERSRKVLEWTSGEVSSRGCAGGFRHYRWLLLQDRGSLDVGEPQQTPESIMPTRGLLVKLYTNSQDFARFESLQEGHVVLLTNLKLLVLTDKAGDDKDGDDTAPPVTGGEATGGPRVITLSRSTNFTQLYIFNQSPITAGDNLEAHVREAMARYPLSIWHRVVQERVAETLRWNAVADTFYSKLLDTALAINKQFSLFPVSTVFLRPWPLSFFQHTHPHVAVHTLRVVSFAFDPTTLINATLVPNMTRQPLCVAIPRKRKLEQAESLLVDFRSSSGKAAENVKVAPEPSGAMQQGARDARDYDAPPVEVSGFPTSPLPPCIDGLLPTVALSIDIEGLNRNATCDNVVLVVPLDSETSTRVAQRRRTTLQQQAAKRPKLNESDSEKDSAERGDQSERTPVPWEDDEKEEIALLSLVRYLALQSLISPDEHAELGRMLAAAQHQPPPPRESTQLCSAGEKEMEDDAKELRAGLEVQWPAEEVRRWLARTTGRKRLVFLLELYARPGGQRVETVATALFPASS